MLPDSLLAIFKELKESGSVSDFPYILGRSMYKKLLDNFRGVQSGWQKICLIDEVDDFKTYDRMILGEMEELKKIPGGGGYKDSKVREDRYQVSIETWGLEFSLLRQVIINDDLRAFSDWGVKMGRTSARSLAKLVVENIIEANAKAYDGVALFSASHVGINNLTSGALTADTTGMELLLTMMRTIKGATTEDSVKVGLNFSQKKGVLWVPTALYDIADVLCNAELITDTTNKVLVANQVRGKLTPVEEPFFTSDTAYYVSTDPSMMHAVEVDFLRGGREPTLLNQVSQFQSLRGGGLDPYAWFDIDEVRYRIRYDYGAKPAYYQGIMKSTGL